MRAIAATSLNVFAPVRPGAEHQLRDALDGLADGEASPFASVPGTHFARWVFVAALTGPGDVSLEADGAYLLMGAEFDGSLRPWTAALCDLAGAEMAPVMDCWQGFPGCHDPRRVAAFFRRYDVPAGFTVAGHRRATVGDVREALRLSNSLRTLAVRAQREALDPRALRRAWSEAISQ